MSLSSVKLGLIGSGHMGQCQAQNFSTIERCQPQ